MCKFSSSRPYSVAFPLCLPDAQIKLPCFRVAQHLVKKEEVGGEERGKRRRMGEEGKGKTKKEKETFPLLSESYSVTNCDHQ